MPDSIDAIDYHRRTKHSPASIQRNAHYLDFENQPLPYKIYSTLAPMALPRDFDADVASCDALDLRGVARLLHFTAAITRTKRYPNGHEHSFRAAACTGALYHIDVYLVCADLAGLEAGVYHFGSHDFALRCLRRGDHRGIVVEASGDQPAIAQAPVILILASTFWRNAWKYQSRAYRHCFWDSGTMLANLLAVATTSQVSATTVVGFADDPLDRLLDLDTNREAVISLVALGEGDTAAAAMPALPSLDYELMPLSHHEVEYPLISAAHAGSSLASGDAARQWREQVFERPEPEAQGTMLALPAPSQPQRSVEEAILRRGSARRFAPDAIPVAALAYMLRAAVAELPADFAPGGGTGQPATVLNDLYLIVNAVEDLQPGAYVYRPQRQALELLKAGDFRAQAGHLDLGQELAADASVNIYALSDLELVVGRLGNRGYRAASLEAAILGGRIYLAAYALGLGATGLTFFDDDVTEFFSPHAAGKGVMFLTAVGRVRRQIA